MVEGSGDYKPNDNFVAAIRELRFVMKFAGIWHRPDSSRWYKFIWYVHSFGIAFDTFGPTAGLIVNRHDASKTIDNLGLLIPLLITFFNWIMLAVHSRTIGKLLDIMEEDWINLERSDSINANVPDSERIMTRYYRTARIFLWTYVTILSVGTALCIRDSVASINQRNGGTYYDRATFLIPYSWYPVNFERGYSYQVVFLAHAIIVVIIDFMKASIDNFFVVVTSNLCAQFEILRCFIENMTYNSSRPGRCEAQVRLMIRRHQELLEAAEKLQTSYSAIIAGHYVSVTLTMCFLGYTIIAEMERTNSSLAGVIKNVSFFGAFLQVIFSYCLVGDRLTNQSIAVAKAVYNSGWYNCPRSVCLSLLISIARANRPVIISGAGLIPMSLESFASLVRASASYLSVLRAVGITDG